MNQSEESRSMLAEVVLNPGPMLLGSWDYLFTWIGTRSWVLVFLTGIPFAALVALLSAAFWPNKPDQSQLILRYLNLVEQQHVETVRSEKMTFLQETEKIEPEAELMLMRILDADAKNERARYLVGLQLAGLQQFGRARQLMRSLAPTSGRGKPAAHAWLATDAIVNRGVRDEKARRDLLHDLSVAAEWEGAGVQLKAAYADVLLSEKQTTQALSVFAELAEDTPLFWLRVAETAVGAESERYLQMAEERVEEMIRSRIDAGHGQAEDYVIAAQFAVIASEPEDALSLCSEGIEQFPSDARLSLIQSEAYRLQYSQESEIEKGQVRMDLLDKAFSADSSNPRLIEEIARLDFEGQLASAAFTEILRNELQSGRASPLTHLLVSLRYLKEGNFAKAIKHLEIVLLSAPNSALVLNNLAVALVRDNPDDKRVLDRAEQLLNRAIAIAGEVPEYLDSLGELHGLQGQHEKAVQIYERVLELDADRVGTRLKLAKAFRELGLAEMAEIQERIAGASE